MITWIIGNSGSGKSTIASLIFRNLKRKNKEVVWLDGDRVREIWPDLKLTKEDRIEQNLRVARLAALLDQQGYEVIISTICPYKSLRKEVEEITGCRFIYIEGGKEGGEYPFEHPKLY